jgi:Ca2+-binding RTX toxin-like protein
MKRLVASVILPIALFVFQIGLLAAPATARTAAVSTADAGTKPFKAAPGYRPSRPGPALPSKPNTKPRLAVGANVNVSRKTGNQMEEAIAIDPTNPSRVFATSNDETLNFSGIATARSSDGGANWTTGVIGTGSDGFTAACCDPSVSWDSFGNLFLAYLALGPPRTIQLLVSTDGGANWTTVAQIDSGANLDQPTVTTGPGAVWVVWRDSNAVGVQARGAAVTGLGAGNIGAFNAEQTAPGSAGGNYSDLAVGPGGQALVAYQLPSGGQGPGTIFVSLDADGLGAGGFGAAVAATTTNVGGFDFIPPQPDRSVDAEPGLAYDRSGGANDGRAYLVYTEETPDESNDTDIMVRFSTNNGAAWSAPVQVNDDAGTNSQFLPRIAVDQSNGDVGVSFHDARNDGPGDPDGANNDAQLFGSRSTNGGASFEANFLVSQGTSDEDGAEPPAPGFADLDYGDYSGLDFFQGVMRPAWGDNSNSTGDNPDGTLNRFDVYTARVAFAPPDISINDVTQNEGDAGTTAFTFTVSLSGASPDTVKVDFATADGTATVADGDYQGNSGTVTFVPGDTSEPVTVLVNGDTKFEPNEDFFVNLSNPVNGNITDGQGKGTILNDDPVPAISIDDVAVDEGNFGPTPATFTVSLSNPSFQTITVDYATADGTATVADNDYLPAAGTVTFLPGDTSENVTVTVSGDTNIEPDEDFFVNLSNPVNASIADGQGEGTIVNDDLNPNAPCTITGTNHNDHLVGTPGNDVICGLNGKDVIEGRGGNDVLIGGNGKDLLLGGDGNDLLLGGNGKDVLDGGNGNDTLRGGNGPDRLTGGPGSDALFGGNGPDRLDTVDGVNGNDLADGGKGPDKCSVDPGDGVVSC